MELRLVPPLEEPDRLRLRLPGSATRSSSAPSAGRTSSVQLNFVRCSKPARSFASRSSFAGNFPSSESTACHCADEASVSTATNATAFAGTTAAAPPIVEPVVCAPAPAQPALTMAIAAATAAAGISRARIALLCRLPAHQPGHQFGEALP